MRRVAGGTAMLRNAVLGTMLLGTAPAGAQEAPLRIAFGDPVSSLDPQLNNNAGDRSVSLFFFDLLVQNNDNALQPGLATTWRAVDPTTWEFALRPGVRWHDGVAFTADDVVFSYARAPSVPGSVASFAGYLRTVQSVEAVDPLTLRIRTKEPNPNLPLNLASVHVVSRHAGERATTEDYNSGRALVGTGPYRYVSYVPGDRTAMRRNDEYWAGPQRWARVDYRYVANPAARTAALLAGDVDVIDKVSVSDIARLRATPTVGLFSFPGLRVLLLQPSFAPGPNQFATGADGKPLSVSPLLDARVRRALSLAINREALVDRLMVGAASAAAQWMPDGTFGYDRTIPPTPYDPDAARRLLAEAGFPNGFNLVLHVPNDRYVAGSESGQAVAQMWTRAGVRTQVETVPWGVYSTRVLRGEYAMTMLAWGNGTGEASYALTNVLGSVEPKLGRGAANWGHYANPAVDKALDDATAAFDDAEREAILRRSAQLVMNETGIIPLFHYANVWAARRGLAVRPLSSDRTVAAMVSGE